MLIKRIKESFIQTHQRSTGESLGADDLARLDAMFDAVEAGDVLARPSKYWIELNKMNLAQLKEHGYDQFKRTIALNYFTWARIMPWDAQFRFLLRELPLGETMRCLRGAIVARRHDYFSAFSAIQSLLYNFLTLAAWAYVRRVVTAPELLALREPLDGQPAIVHDRDGTPLTQDLANSILEVEAIRSVWGKGHAGRRTIVELGPGYGRDAWVLLATEPKVRYVVIDIPPALWVAEKYLGRAFPDKRIFGYRPFERFADVEAEFDQCDIAFFLSTQIASLPAGMADLVINISSLHEMRPDQIRFYLGEFDRLMQPGAVFYTKQWKAGDVLFEGVQIRQEDYPVPPAWTALFARTAPIHTKFFEAAYRK